MKLLDFITITCSNFKKRKFRTIINIFAISIGVILITSLVSLGSGIQSYINNKVAGMNELKHITVNNIDYQSTEEIQKKLTTTDENGEIDIDNVFKTKDFSEEVIKDITSRDEVSEYLLKYTSDLSEITYENKKITDVYVDSYKDKFYLNNEKENIEKTTNKSSEYIIAGRELKTNDKNSVLLPKDIVETTFGINDVSKIINKEITIKDIIPDYEKDKVLEKKLKVIGIINDCYYQPNIVVSNDIMKELKSFKENKELNELKVDTIELTIKNIDNASTLVDYIENKLGYVTDSVQTVANTINTILFWIKVVLFLVGLIVIGIAALDVVNTMIMSVYERTKFIGIMRATGGTKRDVKNLFLVEGATIGFIGGTIGFVSSYFLLKFIRKIIENLISTNYPSINISFLSNVVTIDYKVALMTILFTILLTILASLYPSIKASKLDPIEALKHE